MATFAAAIASRASLPARRRSAFAVQAAASLLTISRATLVVVSLLDSMREGVGLKMPGSDICFTVQAPFKEKGRANPTFSKTPQ
jgi:hypothetical protein